MRRGAFGKRQGLPSSNTRSGSARSSGVKVLDIVGVVLLAILGLLVIDGHILSGHSANSFIDIICRVIELPKDFAGDWSLRTSIGLPVVQILEAPLGVLGLPSARSFLVAAHQASLVVGLGAAFFLDIYLAQFLKHRAVTHQTLDLVHFGSRLVTWGLGAIWFTGGAILAYYFFWAPELLQNPKIWAKLVIVLGLTINGMFIHRYAITGLRECLGKSILDQSMLRVALTSLPLTSVSIVSWGFAFLLGAFKELNNTYDASAILLGYFAALAATYCILVLVCSAVRYQSRRCKITGAAIRAW